MGSMAGDLPIADRLRAARQTAGYESAREAYDAFDNWKIGYEGYVHHENGTRAFSIADAIDYCEKFDVNLEWLANGRGAMRGRSPMPPTDTDYLDLRELQSDAKEQIRNLAKVLK